MTEDAYSRLRSAIVGGQLQPNQRLVEADLAEELGAGRAAIRTALARLSQEGLVEHQRNRGARVRLVSEGEAVQILEARAVLEGLISRHAAGKANADDIADLRAILAELQHRLEIGDLLSASDQNAVLHDRILTIADHPIVSRLISGLSSQLVRFQYKTILLPSRSESSLGEHTAIVEAIAAGDPDEAEAAMRFHLSRVADALRVSAGKSVGSGGGESLA